MLWCFINTHTGQVGKLKVCKYGWGSALLSYCQSVADLLPHNYVHTIAHSLCDSLPVVNRSRWLMKDLVSPYSHYGIELAPGNDVHSTGVLILSSLSKLSSYTIISRKAEVSTGFTRLRAVSPRTCGQYINNFVSGCEEFL